MGKNMGFRTLKMQFMMAYFLIANYVENVAILSYKTSYPKHIVMLLRVKVQNKGKKTNRVLSREPSKIETEI